MRLLLTRAVEDAARTREKLAALGHSVIVSPMIEMIGTGATWPEGLVDGVLATSGQAFWVSLKGPSLEARRVMPLYLVGARTAEMAERHGFLGAALVANNAASLAIAMGKLGADPKRIVYLAGLDRKPDIEAALEVIGQKLDLVEVYEARSVDTLSPEATKAMRQHLVDAVLHFSRRSAGLFASAMSTAGLDVRRLAHLCLSDDVATPLKSAGCDAIHIADKPTEAGLIALLNQM